MIKKERESFESHSGRADEKEITNEEKKQLELMQSRVVQWSGVAVVVFVRYVPISNFPRSIHLCVNIMDHNDK